MAEDKKVYVPVGTGKIDEIRLRQEHKKYALEKMVTGEPYEDDFERWKKSLTKTSDDNI